MKNLPLNLQDKSFCNMDLQGWDFSGHDIRGCDFQGAQLAGANFRNAIAGESEKQLLRQEENVHSLTAPCNFIAIVGITIIALPSLLFLGNIFLLSAYIVSCFIILAPFLVILLIFWKILDIAVSSIYRYSKDLAAIFAVIYGIAAVVILGAILGASSSGFSRYLLSMALITIILMVTMASCGLFGASSNTMEPQTLTRTTRTGTNFREAYLNHANFGDAVLICCDFQNVVAKNVDFSGAALTRCNFRDSSIKHSDFSNAILTDCDFRYASTNHVNWGNNYNPARDMEQSLEHRSQYL
jgi:uncharacterized protein YjbI with pentapeptide repeats